MEVQGTLDIRPATLTIIVSGGLEDTPSAVIETGRFLVLVIFVTGVAWTAVEVLTTGITGAGRLLLTWRLVFCGLDSAELAALAQRDVRDWFTQVKELE